MEVLVASMSVVEGQIFKLAEVSVFWKMVHSDEEGTIFGKVKWSLINGTHLNIILPLSPSGEVLIFCGFAV